MPKLKSILVVHTTSTEDKANSAADFSLEISRPGPDVTLPFPKNPGQRQQGKLDVYQFNVAQHNVDSDAAGLSLIMTIKSSDGWLPTSIVVLGQTEDGELTLLGNHPFWDRWFDSGADAVDNPSHEISGGDIPVFESEG
jgi:hypothetical protein